MSKLSKAQQRELERIRQRYEVELAHELKAYQEDIKEQKWTKCGLSKEYFEEHLKMAENGYILWPSNNSRTLEILAEHNLIEYIKEDNYRSYPIDFVKLVKED